MSTSVTSLNQHLATEIEKLFAGETKNVDVNDSRVNMLVNYLDRVIQHGYNHEDGVTTKTTAHEVRTALNEIAQSNVLFKDALSKVSDEVKTNHIDGVEHSLPKELLKHCAALHVATSILDEQAKKATSNNNQYDEAREAELKAMFFSELQNVYQDIIQMKEGREEAFKEALKTIATKVNKEFGKGALESLSGQIKDATALSYCYSMCAKAGVKLPSISNEQELETLEPMIDAFKAYDFSKINNTNKTNVLSFVESIAEKKGELDLELQAKIAKFTPEEKAYYEFLRQGAQEIKDIENNPADLLKTLTKNIPDLIMPAVIGAAIGYLMGGMEVVGGIGALAIHFLGAKNDAVLSGDTRKPPPLKKPDFYSQAA